MWITSPRPAVRVMRSPRRRRIQNPRRSQSWPAFVRCNCFGISRTLIKMFGTVRSCLIRTKSPGSTAADPRGLPSTIAFGCRSANCAIDSAACPRLAKRTASGAGYGSRRLTTRLPSRATHSCSSRSSSCSRRVGRWATRSSGSTWRYVGTPMPPTGSTARRSTWGMVERRAALTHRASPYPPPRTHTRLGCRASPKRRPS